MPKSEKEKVLARVERAALGVTVGVAVVAAAPWAALAGAVTLAEGLLLGGAAVAVVAPVAAVILGESSSSESSSSESSSSESSSSESSSSESSSSESSSSETDSSEDHSELEQPEADIVSSSDILPES